MEIKKENLKLKLNGLVFDFINFYLANQHLSLKLVYLIKYYIPNIITVIILLNKIYIIVI
jgi:hypothetical protein